MVTETRNLPRSGSISSTIPFWFWNGPSATLTVSPTSNETFGFTFSSRSFICASIDSTSDGRIGMGLSLVPANPITPGVSLMKYQVIDQLIVVIEQMHVHDKVTGEKFSCGLAFFA